MLRNVFKTRDEAIFIAEIGLNHNGDAQTARRMVDEAAAAGAHAVKFQVIDPSLMNSEYTSALLAGGHEGTPDSSHHDFFARFVFSSDEYREIQKCAHAQGVLFFSSVFDAPSLEILEGLNVPLYKIASSEVTNHPLIRETAKTGKPVIMSTGISTEKEIAEAVNIFTRNSSAGLVLMHCVSVYPALPEQINIERIRTLRERFGLDVGFSDHTAGPRAAVLAACAGARFFEKHFTIDSMRECPDKDVSVTPDEFSEYTAEVKQAIIMMGDGTISYGSAEQDTARAARRSLFASRRIPEGKIIDDNDLVALRPGVGISPAESDKIIGKAAAVDITGGSLIRCEYLKN